MTTSLLPADRRRLARYVLLGVGGLAAGYAAYCIYRSDVVTEGRKQVARLRAALEAYANAFGTGADTLQLLLSDLRAFLLSDRQEVPPSLRQLARLMQSQEVADTTSATVAALMRGVSKANMPTVPADGMPPSAFATAPSGPPGPSALDKLLEAALSERGQNLLSVAVSLGARNLVAAYCETQHRLALQDAAAALSPAGRPLPPQQQGPDLTNRLLDFLGSARGQQMAVLAVSAFVSSGVRAYLDQTIDINFYEDLFSAMAKPEHLDAVKACVGVFARDVVAAYLAGPQAAAAGLPPLPHVPPPPRAQLRLSASIERLLGRSASGEQQQPQDDEQGMEGAADSGSPCGSSASRQWAAAPGTGGAAAAVAAASDIDSDVLLQPEAGRDKAGGEVGGDSARSHEGAWAVRTPPAAAEPPASATQAEGAAAVRAALPQLRRVQAAHVTTAGASISREGSGNLEWISAVGKEWLNVAQHPQGRSVMVELAGTAAKEAAKGVSAALADRVRMEWLVVAAFAMCVLAWLMHRMLALLLG